MASQRSNSQDSLSVRVVKHVAAHEGIDPMDVSPPLHNVVNTTALDSFFETAADDHSRSGEVTFTYRGHTIDIEKDDLVRITIVEEDKFRDRLG